MPLDYLADDTLDAPPPAAPALSDAERIVLDLAHEIGLREAVRMLTLMGEDMKRPRERHQARPAVDAPMPPPDDEVERQWGRKKGGA